MSVDIKILNLWKVFLKYNLSLFSKLLSPILCWELCNWPRYPRPACKSIERGRTEQTSIQCGKCNYQVYTRHHRITSAHHKYTTPLEAVLPKTADKHTYSAVNTRFDLFLPFATQVSLFPLLLPFPLVPKRQQPTPLPLHISPSSAITNSYWLPAHVLKIRGHPGSQILHRESISPHRAQGPGST